MYVSLRVQATLNDYELAALLWDGLVSGSNVDPTAAMVGLLSKAQVRELVRNRLITRGTASVMCGPTNEQDYSEVVEEACVSAVRRAFPSEGD